jgi:hypothetical protein
METDSNLTLSKCKSKKLTKQMKALACQFLVESHGLLLNETNALEKWLTAFKQFTDEVRLVLLSGLPESDHKLVKTCLTQWFKGYLVIRDQFWLLRHGVMTRVFQRALHQRFTMERYGPTDHLDEERNFTDFNTSSIDGINDLIQRFENVSVSIC